MDPRRALLLPREGSSRRTPGTARRSGKAPIGLSTLAEHQQRLDVHTLAPDGAAVQLGPNDIGRVRLQLAQPLPIERHAVSRIGGGFVLIDEATQDTVAAGLVTG